MNRGFLITGTLLLLPLFASAADTPLRQTIDAEIKTAWQREKITPAAKSSDAEFLRRVSLDLVGTIPSYDETIAFLNDKSNTKREALIDKLLADPRYATNQADIWDQVFFGRRPAGGDMTRKRDDFKKWVADQFAKNTPYDKFIHNLLLAEQPGSEMFYVQFRNNPEEATTAVTRMFLGTQLQCARCHDHPFDKWTQKDFYGMAGFFVRLTVGDGGGKGKYVIGEKGIGEVLFTGAVKDQKPGQKGEPVKPKFLGGDELKEPPTDPKLEKAPAPKENAKLPKPAFSRKEKIAAWVTAPENPYFAKAAANRVWAQFMGRGIVHPVDDIGEKNKPSMPKLLDDMAQQLAEHKYDLKWLIKELVSSEAYQLAAKGPSKDALPMWYEQARVRPLSAEEMMAVIRQGSFYDAGDPKSLATKIPNAGDEYFLRYFGEPTNGLGDFQGSLSEHLFLNNGSIWQIIRRKKGNLVEILATSKDTWEQKVDRLYLTVLNRPAKDVEKAKFAEFLKGAAGAKSDSPYEEAIWVLMNSAEFRFNH